MRSFDTRNDAATCGDIGLSESCDLSEWRLMGPKGPHRAPPGPAPGQPQEAHMGAGLGIFLIVVGAILAFAVKTAVSGVDLVMVGYICMGAGVLALLFSLVQMNQRGKTEVRQVVERRDVVAAPPPAQDPRQP